MMTVLDCAFSIPIPGMHYAKDRSADEFSANPLALPASPPGVTGVFGAQVVAVDASTGAVVGATFAGWSCVSPGPAQFDGSYEIDALAVGHSYTVYTEALNGAVDPSQISNAIGSLCRNVMTD